MAQNIDVFENPFLGMEGKIKKTLGEADEQGYQQVEATEMDGEQQMFETFVKEKNTLLSYVHDLIRFAAKLQDIDIETGKILGEQQAAEQPEESKDPAANAELRIKSEKDCANIANRINGVLEKYQEQSSVLDTILDAFVTPIMHFLQLYVRKAVANQAFDVPTEVKALFLVLCQLCKVRGYKTVVKFFPHEVSDMEQVVELLHFQATPEQEIERTMQPADTSNWNTQYWQVPYILVLWLSIIVLVPFDLTTIDSQRSQEILVKRIINIGRSHCVDPGKIRDGAAVLLSKLITRPDVVRSGELDEFLQQMTLQFVESQDNARAIYIAQGVLQTLVQVFKTGHRDDLLSRVDSVYNLVLRADTSNKFMKKSSHIKKGKVNLAQRIGCIFLKPKIASWRYQRGHRSLAQNLASSGVAAQIISNTGAQAAKQDQHMREESKEEEDDAGGEDELDDEQIEKLEFIIQFLLDALKDDDSIVRWTAAKGIGRITMRLSADFADQIVGQLTDLFGASETDSSWHGGCLALAELCRRGLLLPDRLSEFVPVLEKALVYDLNLGNHSVGAHVRDAACYVVWSFARAYSPDIMRPHVMALAAKLVNISLFDREVNCRRAASATFQEAVGRQGTFPHGIEILTEADYFTLSNRVNAFLNVSCFVGQFEEYWLHMLKYLAEVQLKHWEPAMRQLAAQSLSVLSVFNAQQTVTEILGKTIDNVFSKALYIRHGAIMGVSEMIIGLSGNSVVHRQQVLEKAFKTLSLKERNLIKEETANQRNFKERYDQISGQNQLDQCMPAGSEILNRVKTLVSEIEKQRLYRGKGGEIMRSGVCHLIHSLSQARIQFDESELRQFFSTLKENLRHPNQSIQEEATNAFKSYCNAYFAEDLPQDRQFIIAEIRDLLGPSTNDQNIAVTKGYNMALGVLSGRLLQEMSAELIQTLSTNCIAKGQESDDAETRKQAVKSLVSVIMTLGIERVGPELLSQALDTMFATLNDYQLDRRGDVGSWVREEAMQSLTSFVQTLVEQGKDKPELLQAIGADQPAFWERYVRAILQQLVEKIDRVREVAGRQLQLFFKNSAAHVCDFAEKDALTALFTQEYAEGADEAAGGAIETHIHDEGIAYLPWRSGEFVFEQILPFFDSETYSLSIFKGLVTSSGGLTESTLKASSKTLFKYLSDMKGSVALKSAFIHKLIQIFEDNLRDERVTIPLMKTIEMLLESGYLQENELCDDLKKIHALTVSECNKSKNIVKLMGSVGVFANMLSYQDQELCIKALRSLLFLLYHTFPKVRDTTAQKLYTSLLSLEEYELIVPGGEDDYDAAIDMISETDWSLPTKALRESTQQKFYAFFGQTVRAQPAAATAASASGQQQISTT